MVEQAGEIADRVLDVVRGRIRRRIRLAHAAHVWRDHAPARGGESGDLVAPGEPQVREAMAQHHERACALFDVVHADAVHLRIAMGPVGHGPHSSACGKTGALVGSSAQQTIVRAYPASPLTTFGTMPAS